MIPLVLGATYLGFPYFNIFIALAVVLMAWEWRRMISSGHFGYQGVILAVGLLGSVLIASYNAYLNAVFLTVGVGVVFIAVTAARRLFSGLPLHSDEMNQAVHPQNSLWMAFGALYIGIPSLAFIWIRNDWENGLVAVVWLLVLVWAADSGAYAAGRLIGGPKMAPKISPNKTWAGLAGCVVSAAVAGGIVAHLAGFEGLIKFIAVSAFVGLISQGGDLVESAFKRHFKVKDSSNLIPGHGGVLDRVDALLAAVVAAALINLVDKGSLVS
jgi:phosphatidate cytidylyltransferase